MAYRLQLIRLIVPLSDRLTLQSASSVVPVLFLCSLLAPSDKASLWFSVCATRLSAGQTSQHSCFDYTIVHERPACCMPDLSSALHLFTAPSPFGSHSNTTVSHVNVCKALFFSAFELTFGILQHCMCHRQQCSRLLIELMLHMPIQTPLIA